MKRFDFTLITAVAFLLIGTPLIYAVWFRLFWLNVWWGLDFGLVIIALCLVSLESSAPYLEGDE